MPVVITSAPLSKRYFAVTGVMPLPSAEFSPFTITVSILYSFLSSGNFSLRLAQDFCPTTSPIKSIFNKTRPTILLSYLLSFDYLLSVGAYTYHRDVAVAEFFKSFDVLLARLGQLVKAAAGRYIIIKALESFIYGYTIGKLFKRCREVLNNSAVGLLISNAHL